MYIFLSSLVLLSEGINYLVVRPEGDENEEDQVAEFCQSLLYWAAMIAQNEYEKVSASELVRTFDVDGGSPVSYSEEFSSDYSASGEVKSPLSGGLGKIASSLVGSLANAINQETHTENQNKLPHFGVEMPDYKFGMTLMRLTFLHRGSEINAMAFRLTIWLSDACRCVHIRFISLSL